MEAAEGCGVTKDLDYQVAMCRGLGETQRTRCSVLGREPVSWLGVGEGNAASEDSLSPAVLQENWGLG